LNALQAALHQVGGSAVNAVSLPQLVLLDGLSQVSHVQLDAIPAARTM
jgi:hypothetical protein